MDEFDFAARPSVNKPQMLELVKGEYLDRRENVLFVGPSGTGKSHLATAALPTLDHAARVEAAHFAPYYADERICRLLTETASREPEFDFAARQAERAYTLRTAVEPG